MIPMALLFAAATALLVGAYSRLALRRGWLDIPNARSSHRQPVPRGAGIAIVLLTVVAARAGDVEPAFFIALAPGLGIAAIGWWDDLRGLPARLRFLTYGGCSLLALLLAAGLPAGWAGSVGLVFGALCLLWLINLYNFMDGINGIATLEAMFVLASGLMLGPHSPDAARLAGFETFMLAILAGFLGWNFPRARVFMGDVCSAFLGFLLGLVAFWSHRHGGPALVIWAILGGTFIVDTTYTLAVRMATGQRWHEAHRSHAYQKLTNRPGGSHVKTVVLTMGVNIAWLLPLAWATHAGKLDAALALPLAYGPLLVLCYALKAGVPPGTKV
jgi:Fuc2NAc and GlcNAc transferase